VNQTLSSRRTQAPGRVFLQAGTGAVLWLPTTSFSLWQIGWPTRSSPCLRESHLGEAVAFFLYDVPKILLLLSGMIFLISILRTFFSPEQTRALLGGKREGVGNVLAALLGIVTPFCSCSAVPPSAGVARRNVVARPLRCANPVSTVASQSATGNCVSFTLKEVIMLVVKVLGSGCTNCKKVEAVARQAVAKLGVEAQVEKVTDYGEIMKYPIMSTPGLVINEKLVAAGRIPTEAEVTTWLTSAQEAA
jgi:small redox-active disulfide protein 2